MISEVAIVVLTASIFYQMNISLLCNGLARVLLYCACFEVIGPSRPVSPGIN